MPDIVKHLTACCCRHLLTVSCIVCIALLQISRHLMPGMLLAGSAYMAYTPAPNVQVLEEEEYHRRKGFYLESSQRHYYFMNVGNGEVIDACRKVICLSALSAQITQSCCSSTFDAVLPICNVYKRVTSELSAMNICHKVVRQLPWMSRTLRRFQDKCIHIYPVYCMHYCACHDAGCIGQVHQSFL